MAILMVLPMVLLFVGLAGSIVVIWKKRRQKQA
ncbi:MAG TPA: DedA family protein, partial [Pantoea sp.]|nr:DedA family protein [Pantoea sp.]